MPMLPSLKKKLKIIACTVSNGKVSDGGDSFEVMLNPGSVKVNHAICYNTSKEAGNIGGEAKFSKQSPDKVNFDLVIDGTGVVGLPVPGLGYDNVKTQIKKLKAIVFKYDGDHHEPNVVKLLWGSFIFYGRLESLSVDYTLFKPGGDPLRAKVSLAFVSFMSKEEEVKKKEMSSPDMTHWIEVKASDTLPALCRRIYGDACWYPEVARANGLVNFRHIPAGTRLIFPPLR